MGDVDRPLANAIVLGQVHYGREQRIGGPGHHRVAFLTHRRVVFGLVDRHADRRDAGRMCGGHLYWRIPATLGPEWGPPRHQLVTGGPRTIRALTIAPSLLCTRCGEHGFIRRGIWIPA